MGASLQCHMKASNHRHSIHNQSMAKPAEPAADCQGQHTGCTHEGEGAIAGGSTTGLGGGKAPTSGAGAGAGTGASRSPGAIPSLYPSAGNGLMSASYSVQAAEQVHQVFHNAQRGAHAQGRHADNRPAAESGAHSGNRSPCAAAGAAAARSSSTATIAAAALRMAFVSSLHSMREGQPEGTGCCHQYGWRRRRRRRQGLGAPRAARHPGWNGRFTAGKLAARRGGRAASKGAWTSTRLGAAPHPAAARALDVE